MIIHVLLLAAFLLNLIVITYQDIRYRSVPVYVFLSASILSFLIQYLRCGIEKLFVSQALLNAGFIALNVVVIFVYVKKIKKIPLVNAIGLGDLAFYVVLIPLFSTPVFIYFHLISLLIILISYPVLKNILSLNTRAIPLAGLQAFCLLCFILAFECFNMNKTIIGSCSLIYWI